MQSLRYSGNASHYDPHILPLLDSEIDCEVVWHRLSFQQLQQANQRGGELFRVEELAHQPLGFLSEFILLLALMRWLERLTFNQLFFEAECAQEEVEKRPVCFCCNCEQDVFVVERLFERLDHRHPIDLALELLVMCYHWLAEILRGSLRIQKKLLNLSNTNFSTHVVTILHHLAR